MAVGEAVRPPATTDLHTVFDNSHARSSNDGNATIATGSATQQRNFSLNGMGRWCSVCVAVCKEVT